MKNSIKRNTNRVTTMTWLASRIVLNSFGTIRCNSGQTSSESLKSWEHLLFALM